MEGVMIWKEARRRQIYRKLRHTHAMNGEKRRGKDSGNLLGEREAEGFRGKRLRRGRGEQGRWLRQ
jgi:hypothetical protein